MINSQIVKLLILIISSSLLFSCNKENIIIDDKASSGKMNLEPFNIISIEEYMDKKNQINFEDKMSVIEVENSVDPETNEEIEYLLRKRHIPVLVQSKEAFNSLEKIIGTNTKNDVVALIYNAPGQGITTEYFEEVDITISQVETTYSPTSELKPFEKLSQEERELLKGVLGEDKDIIKEYNALSVEKTEPKVSEKVSKSTRNKIDMEKAREAFVKILNEIQLISSESFARQTIQSNLSEYRIRTIVRHLNSRFQQSGTGMDYRVITQIAEGSYVGHEETRLFINSTILGNPGISVYPVSKEPETPNTFPYVYDRYSGILERFEPSISVSSMFDQENYGPLQGSVGSGSYSSSQRMGIKLKPIDYEKLVEIDFSMGQSYSYSMPDYYFENHSALDGTFSRKVTSWKWRPGMCARGEYNGGKGLLYNTHWVTDGTDLFVPVDQFPLPMRQTTKNDVHINVSAPISNVGHIELIVHNIKTDINDIEAGAFSFFLGTPFVHKTWLQQYEINAPSFFLTPFV